MASASYAQLVARTSSLLHDHEDLKGIISAAKAGDMLAVLDRNELQGEWRKARLLRLEDTNEDQQWRLLTEDGVVIDEPGNGCPAAGFSTGDLLADVGMTYYKQHESRAASAEEEEREEEDIRLESQPEALQTANASAGEELLVKWATWAPAFEGVRRPPLRESTLRVPSKKA